MRHAHFLRLLLCILLVVFIGSSAQGAVFITIAPPALPIYEQPPCPAEGYIWVPGYWAYGNDFDDYFWVPGTWVLAPEVGFFWTPGYWAWVGDQFVFYDGYWGPQVGFYGGINYGYGYFGEGYVGGRWDHGQFFYNQAVNNVNITNIRNVYNNTTVIQNTTVTRVSYNGGNGGINVRPTREQEVIAHERHIAPIAAQTQHVQSARADPQLRASANQGKPPIAATPRPAELHGRGIVPAREAGAPYRPARNRAVAAPGTGNTNVAPEGGPARKGAVHPNELPPIERRGPPSAANSRSDQKYQRQQEQLRSRQEQERQKLQRKQDEEHRRMQPQAEQSRRQQIEERHQQQTQQLQQRQAQQWEKMQRRQPPPKQDRGEPRGEAQHRPPQ
jgi:hypothetical protein